MDSLQQKPNTKVMLQCPNGHIFLYKHGILVKTLYKNYGLRLMESQKISGVDSKAAYNLLYKIYQREGVSILPYNEFIKDNNLELPTYKLTEKQLLKMGKECNDCKNNIAIEEPQKRQILHVNI